MLPSRILDERVGFYLPRSLYLRHEIEIGCHPNSSLRNFDTSAAQGLDHFVAWAVGHNAALVDQDQPVDERKQRLAVGDEN